MNLHDFRQKYRVVLDAPTLRLCYNGVAAMAKSHDPHHDRTHIEKILSDLDYLLTLVPNLGSRINFGVLLPAICWHDIWISRQKSRGITHLIYQQIVEGRQSAKIFLASSADQIPSSQLKSIAYTIRKHSSLQFLPPLTLEAKILIDLDKLELWNIFRFLGKKNTLQSQKTLYARCVVKWYFIYSSRIRLYFKELDQKLNNKIKTFWDELEKSG